MTILKSKAVIIIIGIACLFCAAQLLRQYTCLVTAATRVVVQETTIVEERQNDKNHSIHTELCHMLNHQSAMSLWIQHAEDILRASQSPLDPQYELHDATTQVFHMITPRLPYGLKSSPHHSIDHVMNTVNRRIAFLKDAKGTSKAPPRPLKILVMGGSVTKGINCNTGIKGYSGVECCWVTRLETLLNYWLLGDDNNIVVQVHLAAVGGTNSATAQAMLDYNLLAEEMNDADIIINAYSTNDMHILTVQEAMNQNLTLRDKLFEMAQNFTRTALQQCTKEGNMPLLFWLDDYLGNEQREIMATTEFSQSVHVLASYYGVGLLSYADTVRDLVYGSTTERSFSPPGWYKKGSDTMKREIHPPYPMHITVSYLVAYAFLQLASNYCDLESWKGLSVENTTTNDVPKQRGGLDTPPQPPPKGLPPPLTSSLSLENVTQLWREAPPTTTCHADKIVKRCPIGWVSGYRLDLTPNNTMHYFEPYMQDPFEWEWRNDKGKFGWLPRASGATMTFDFPLQQTIHRLVLFYMKSYGDKWSNSTAIIAVRVDDDDMDDHTLTFLLNGLHDKATSEVYTEEIQLPREASKRLQMSVQHTGGQTFKLMGFAICS